MTIFGRWVFGTLCIAFGRLHYRHEVRPYCEKTGVTRAEAFRASLVAHKREFDRAWPDDDAAERMKP